MTAPAPCHLLMTLRPRSRMTSDHSRSVAPGPEWVHYCGPRAQPTPPMANAGRVRSTAGMALRRRCLRQRPAGWVARRVERGLVNLPARRVEGSPVPQRSNWPVGRQASGACRTSTITAPAGWGASRAVGRQSLRSAPAANWSALAVVRCPWWRCVGSVRGRAHWGRPARRAQEVGRGRIGSGRWVAILAETPPVGCAILRRRAEPAALVDAENSARVAAPRRLVPGHHPASSAAGNLIIVTPSRRQGAGSLAPNRLRLTKAPEAGESCLRRPGRNQVADV